MARDFGPFPTKPMYEVVNRRMQRALAKAVAATGFTALSQGVVSAGTGAQLVIAAYPDGALVDGLYVENPASETVTLTTNASSSPRIDRLVMRLDMGTQTIAPFQIVGTPAASPQVPPLVQTASVFDMPLCRYTMPGSGSAQNPGSIVDERLTIDRPNQYYSPVAWPNSAPTAGTNNIVSTARSITPNIGACTAQVNLDLRVLFGAGSTGNAELQLLQNGVVIKQRFIGAIGGRLVDGPPISVQVPLAAGESATFQGKLEIPAGITATVFNDVRHSSLQVVVIPT